jgi:ankyrin repeat protein
MVLLLLAHGADMHAQRRGETALHRAMIQNQKEMVRFLLEKGLESTPLNVAAFFGELDVMKELISKGADINGRDASGYSPLLCATCGCQSSAVGFLLASKVDVNAKDNRGYTALHAAASQAGQKSTVGMLIAAGANVNAGAEKGATPLYWASYEGRTEVAELLIARGADVNSRQYEEDYTPLHIACRNGHVDTAELLIERGAQVNARAKEGETPLSLAMQRTRQNRQAVLSLLRKHGANE